MIFKNRQDAGQKLAKKLKKYEKNPQALVLGLARGGVILAAEISHILNISNLKNKSYLHLFLKKLKNSPYAKIRSRPMNLLLFT